jgi:hypothetical protein
LTAELVAEGTAVPRYPTGLSFAQWLKLLPFVPDITPMWSLRLFTRPGYRSTLSVPSSLRVEVQPPSLRHAPSSPWQRLMFWLLAPGPRDAAPPLNRLPAVRIDFMQCLSDINDQEAHGLGDRIATARSLRELWHLRADVYRLVAVHHSQFEAEERVALLNRHFPTRAPRSAFAPLL